MERFLQAILVVLLCSCPCFASAQETVRVLASGEAAIANVTPEEAQRTALQRARVNAVEKACGVKVKAESLVKDFILQGEFIHSVSYGHIIDEKIKRWDLDIEQRDPASPPDMAYRVTIQAGVQKEQGEPDESFRVNVKLNKLVYQTGDEMLINVRATKPGYLTILNFTADDKVVVLYPNFLRKNNKLEPGKVYQIPAAEDRRGVMKFQVGNLPGHTSDIEYIKAIVTRRPFPILDEIEMQGHYGVMNTSSIAVTEITRLIASVPIQERADNTVAYEVVRRP